MFYTLIKASSDLHSYASVRREKFGRFNERGRHCSTVLQHCGSSSHMAAVTQRSHSSLMMYFSHVYLFHVHLMDILQL